MKLPFAEACEQNKTFICDAIDPYLVGEVLEIGSGTGQHAVYFAAGKPELVWQTSDLEPSLPGIRAWIDHSGLANLPPPIALDVFGAWPQASFDLIFSANTFHIMSEAGVAAMASKLRVRELKSSRVSG